jgi:hypothetical protein
MDNEDKRSLKSFSLGALSEKCIVLPSKRLKLHVVTRLKRPKVEARRQLIRQCRGMRGIKENDGGGEFNYEIL